MAGQQINGSEISPNVRSRMQDFFLKFVQKYSNEIQPVAAQTHDSKGQIPMPFEVLEEIEHEGYSYSLIRQPSKKKVRLTPCQFQVALWAACGEASKKIADIFGISIHTVCEHLRNVYRALNIHKRSQLAQYVLFRKSN